MSDFLFVYQDPVSASVSVGTTRRLARSVVRPGSWNRRTAPAAHIRANSMLQIQGSATSNPQTGPQTSIASSENA
jgi:hypothetical protein